MYLRSNTGKQWVLQKRSHKSQRVSKTYAINISRLVFMVGVFCEVYFMGPTAEYEWAVVASHSSADVVAFQDQQSGYSQRWNSYSYSAVFALAASIILPKKIAFIKSLVPPSQNARKLGSSAILITLPLPTAFTITAAEFLTAS